MGRRYRKLLYQTALRLLPYSVKYGLMTAWQRALPPYHLVKAGDTVVQVGAAGPLCPLGRSQAIIYARLVGKSGKVFAIEAIPENLESFRSYIRRQGIDNIEPYNMGLWKEKGVLIFDAAPEGNPSPASQIKHLRTEEKLRYGSDRALPVDTLDNLLPRFDIARLDLINVTTNGGEAEILAGGAGYLARFRPALCVPARKENEAFFDETLAPLGYRKHRDRVRLHPLGPSFEILWAAAERPDAGESHGRA